MRRGLARHMERRAPSTFKIQITSMVDMFVILLVFLLKSYSTSPVNVTPSDDMKLPLSSSFTDPLDAVKLVVSKKGIFLDDKKIAEIENLQIARKEIDNSDPNFVSALFKALDETAKHTKEIAKVNETVSFDGKLLMQADRDLPYSLLQKVMYTSMLAGYSDLKLAVVAKDF